VISTDDEEYRISFTADGLRAYFARSSAFFPQARQATIYESTWVDGAWTEPVVVTFSGTHPDIDPWVAPDGQSLVFSSIRPTGGESRRDAELFRVDRVGDGWSDPVHLAELGSASDELGATVAGDGTIVFASDRPGGSGGWDLFAASPTDEGYAEPEPIRALNSPIWEFNPAIDASGGTLVFTSIGRDGGSGLGDLFVATRSGSGWSEARPLTVNTSADEYHPSLAPDGRTLYFVRRTTQGDLVSAPWAEAAPPD
jgi:Tol biopolymer transport system component